MIVVDTNILCLRWIPAPESALSDRLLVRDSHWITPLLWRSEFRNVLIGYVRRGSLTLAAAVDLARHAEAEMRDREFSTDALHVLQLAAVSSCTAYDCEFVALANEQGIPLITMDRQVLRQFPTVAVSLRDFAHF